MNFNDVMDPKFTGGASLDWNITSKLTLSTNTYFYTGYQIYGHPNRPAASEVSIVNGTTTLVDVPNGPFTSRKEGSRIQGKVIFNAKIDYKIGKGLSAFINARNLTNNTNREWQFTDQIGGFYLLGLSYIY